MKKLKLKGSLTQKQVRALSRSLKRRGRKLPKVGMCAIFRTPDLVRNDPAIPGVVIREHGSKTVEVCRDRHGYYVVGRYDRDKRERRRADRMRAGKAYKRVRYDNEGYASGLVGSRKRRR